MDGIYAYGLIILLTLNMILTMHVHINVPISMMPMIVVLLRCHASVIRVVNRSFHNFTNWRLIIIQ